MYREEYSTIVGSIRGERSRLAVHVEHDGVKKVCVMNMSKPVTLQRFKDLAAKLKREFGLDYEYLSVKHSVYEYDVDLSSEEIHAITRAGDYVPCEKTVDKYYQFWVDENRLLIWDKGEPVYENDNGVITSDPTALADTYM